MEFAPTLTIFLFVDWTEPYQIEYVFRVLMFFLYVFRHMHLFFLDSCSYPFYLPKRKLTKIYIPFEKLLWTILCSEEHT